MDELLVGEEPTSTRINGSRRSAHPRTDGERLAAERAALRQVAKLVADRADPSAVFDAATIGLGRSIQAAKAGLWRFETTGEITTVAGAAEPAKLVTWPVGSRQPVAGSHLHLRLPCQGRSSCLPSQYGALPAAANRETHGSVVVPSPACGRIMSGL
jgi:hypothetical protein